MAIWLGSFQVAQYLSNSSSNCLFPLLCIGKIITWFPKAISVIHFTKNEEKLNGKCHSFTQWLKGKNVHLHKNLSLQHNFSEVTIFLIAHIEFSSILFLISGRIGEGIIILPILAFLELLKRVHAKVSAATRLVIILTSYWLKSRSRFDYSNSFHTKVFITPKQKLFLTWYA